MTAVLNRTRERIEAMQTESPRDNQECEDLRRLIEF